MITNNTLKIGEAFIVDGEPMVLTDITNGRYSFTDGRYGFGRCLGRRPSDAKILNSLKVAEGVDTHAILGELKASIKAMVTFNQSRK